MSDILKWDLRFLEMAKSISTWSKDPSTKVGAVIASRDNRIISQGYNGFPRQMVDNVDHYIDRNEKYSRVIHAEMNALLFAKESVENCTLYIWPFLPCDRCFVHMLQSGINRYVAPLPPTEVLSRWGPTIDKVRKYINETGCELIELDL